MASAASKIVLSQSRDIPFNQLVLSQANVRRVKTGVSIEALAEDIARRSALPPKAVSAAALDWLARQSWPGNIRELRNTLEQAALMTDDALLEPRHFGAAQALVAAAPDPPAAAAAPTHAPLPPSAEPLPADAAALLRPLAQQVAELERAAIGAALRATRGNRVATARLLGMSRAALYERLARWPELGGRG